MNLTYQCRGPPEWSQVDHGFSFTHKPMFSPSEYLTNLHQAQLLNRLVTPAGQLPQIPFMRSNESAIPVVTAVPIMGTCGDIIAAVGGTSLLLKAAAILATGLIMAYFVKKYGPSVLAWFCSNMQQLVASVSRKLSWYRRGSLTPAIATVVVTN